jgi:hypothetical protein
MGKVFLISYDLMTPGQAYDSLIRALEKAGAKKALYSAWFLRTTSSASEVRDWLMKLVDTNDRIFVTEATGWASYNLTVNPDKI